MKKLPHHSGFTLVETLVAIAIVLIAVSGPLFAANRTLVAAELANTQLTASYLAQEGIEYIDKMRDDAFLTDPTSYWTDFINTSVSACEGGNYCALDPFSNTLTACGTNHPTCDNYPLYLNASNEYTTTETDGTLTPYSRSIQVTSVGDDEVEVGSTVTWQFHGTTYTVSAHDTLTDWL